MTLQKKEKLQTVIKDYTIMLTGLILYVLSWTLFLVPAKITGGGISGLAAVIFYSTKIPIGLTFFCHQRGIGLHCHKSFGGKLWHKNDLQHGCSFAFIFCST